MLASEPGTGKTYVLGGAMRELIDAGAKQITYVTLNTELIDQAKKDVAGFKLGDRVNYVTYTALRKMPPEATDVLIFDEAHLIKNTIADPEGELTIAQARAAQEWMKEAKFSIFASATPFENATQMKYLEPTGIFKDVFITFRDFALAFGATPASQDTVAWVRTTTSDADARAARDWLIREGVYTSRRIRLPIEQIDSRLVRVKADKKIADLYAKLMEAISEAAANPNVTSSRYSRAWLQNFKKRLLEASKVDIAIKEAKSAIARGRYPIVFVETKAARDIDISELVRQEENWKRDAAMARRSKEPPPKRKEYGLPPNGITEILALLAAKTGENEIIIPSALSLFREAFGRDQVAIYTGKPTKAGTDYGVSKEEAARNLKEWREGKRKLLVATMAKGGTGLSLHDTVGDHPTTQININLPWVPTQVVQVAQRSVRYGLKGRAEMAWLFADNIPFDRQLARMIGNRMADLGSLVHGEKLKGTDEFTSFNVEDPSFSEAEEEDIEDEDQDEDEDTPSDVLSDADDVPDPLTGRKAAAGKPTSEYPEGVEPIEVPEALEIIEELLGQVPKVSRRMGAETRGQFEPSKGLISLNAALFKEGQEQQLAKTLLHEFGHAVDWLDDKDLKRGNLLGRLKSLSQFLKHTFTNPDGTTIKLAEIKQELTALSDAWRKWDKSKSSDTHKKYRASSVELFADALSALFNDPGYVAEVAPVFYGEFLRSLDRKPDVKTVFDNIQSVIRRGRDDRETLINRRIDREIADFELASRKAIEGQRELQAASQASRKNIWQRLKLQHLDVHYWVVDKLKDLRRRGVEVNEHDDPFTALGERNYMGGKQKGWTDRNIAPLLDMLEKVGMTWDEFGVYLKADRIVSGDRGNAVGAVDDVDDADDLDDLDDLDDADDADDVDEPIGQQIPNRGGTPKDAEELLNQLLKRLGPKKVRVLEQVVPIFRSVVREMVEDGYQAGLYTHKTYERMKRNPAYATNRVIDYMTDKVSYRIYKQRGSLKAIDNPASATTLKMLSTLRMVEHQKVKAIVFNFLERHFPDEIQQATVTRGKDGKRTVQPPKDRSKWELVLYMRMGRLEGKYVSPTIADSINNSSIGSTLATVMIMRRLNSGWFRPVFTSMNLGFQTVNIVRDMLRYWKNMPDTTLAKMLANYWRAIPMAKVRAFGLSDPEAKGIKAQAERIAMRLVGITRAKELQGAEDLLQAEETMQLSITFNDLMKGRHIEDTQIDDILSRMSVRVGQPPISLGRKLVTLKPLTDFIQNMGDFIETLPKAAAMHQLKGKGQVRDISPAMRSLIRRKIGSPDYLAGGTAKPIFNELFLFSNAILQAWRSDIEVATDLRKNPTTGIYESPSGFWWKTAAINVLPKFLMMAALSGMLDRWWWGEEYARMLEKISEYDKTNYLVIPVRENAKGEVTYLRIPTDDTGRLIGGLFWKALRLARGDKGALETTAQVLTYTLGNMPTPAPAIGLVSDATQMLAGQNPYDSFRGRNVFTQDQWLAKDATMMIRLGEHLFQELGGSAVSNPLNRWIRTSSYGETEQLRAAGDAITTVEARLRNKVKEELKPVIERFGNMPESDRTRGVAFGMAREVVNKIYADRSREERDRRTNDVRKTILMGAVLKTADPLTEQLVYTQSNKEKVAIAATGLKPKTRAQREQWLTGALRNGVISREVFEDIRRQQPN